MRVYSHFALTLLGFRSDFEAEEACRCQNVRQHHRCILRRVVVYSRSPHVYTFIHEHNHFEISRCRLIDCFVYLGLFTASMSGFRVLMNCTPMKYKILSGLFLFVSCLVLMVISFEVWLYTFECCTVALAHSFVDDTCE